MSDSPVVEVADLTVRVAGTTAVDGVSLTIRPGERWGLIGGSGAGKSLTAAAVAGLLPPAATASGSVRVVGTELVGAAERTLAGVRGRGVVLIAQDSAVALNPLVRVGAQVARPLRTLHGLARREASARAVERLAAVGLPDLARSYPAQLSGGQRQRVALAAALACGARLLVADEPTAALDPTVARELLGLLDRSLRSSGGDRVGAFGDAAPTGTAALFVTHDLATLAQVCDHVAVMRDGRIVETGTVDGIVGAPRHAHTRELVEAARLLAPSTLPAVPTGATPTGTAP